MKWILLLSVNRFEFTLNFGEKEFHSRDVGVTSYFEKDDGRGTWSISARGTGYLIAFSEEEFIKLCEILNVEILMP